MTDLQRPKSSSCPRLAKSRSRCPLSVDDVPICEKFLSKQSQGSLQSTFTSCDSGFHSSVQITPCSTSSLSRTQGDVFQFLEEDEHQLFLSDKANNNMPSVAGKSAVKDGSIPIKTQYKKSVSMDLLFSEINEELGPVWEKLGRNLLQKECSVQNINKDFDCVEEKAFQVLIKWKKEKGSEATLESLMESLVHIGCTKIAESLLDYRDFNGITQRTSTVDQFPKPMIVYNTDEKPRSFTIQKTLSANEKVFLWQHNTNGKKYVIKEIEKRPNVWTARKAIDCKALCSQKLRLRKTEDFLKDLQVKEDMVNHLLGVVKRLQDHLSTNHAGFCQKGTKCEHCPRLGLKKDLIINELALLQHQLQRMIAGNRRCSVSGIPTDRIYNIADRTHNICEEHKALHEQAKSKKCSNNNSSSWVEDEEDERIEKSLKCTLNILFIIGRRRLSVQSLKPPKKNKERKKVKRNKSTFYVSLKRESYLMAQENPLMIGDLNINDYNTAESSRCTEMKDLRKANGKTWFAGSWRHLGCDKGKFEKLRDERQKPKKAEKQKTRAQSCDSVAVGPQVSMGTPSQSSSSSGSNFNRRSFPFVRGFTSTSWSQELSEGDYGDLLLDEVEDTDSETPGECVNQAHQGGHGRAVGDQSGTEVQTASSLVTHTSHVTYPPESSQPSSTSSRPVMTSDHCNKNCKMSSGEISSLGDIQWMQDLDYSEIICV